MYTNINKPAKDKTTIYISVYVITIPLVLLLSGIYSYFILHKSILISIGISLITSGILTGITIPAISIKSYDSESDAIESTI